MNTQPPAAGSGGGAWQQQALLFTPGARLGWTFRDRRQLITPYAEPEPDPEAIAAQVKDRAAAAGRSYQRARKWVARPSLMLAVALIALAGCAHAFNPAAPFSTMIVTAAVLAVPGLGWTGWRFARLTLARSADPQRQYQIAHAGWAQRVAGWKQAELTRLGNMPEWGSAEPPARRTNIFGGTLAGWQSMLIVHGASILAGRPLLVADLTGQYAAVGLAALARDAGVQTAEYVLPRDLVRCGLLARLSPRQLAEALAEAIHADAPAAARADRAVDVRVLERLSSTLHGGGITLARLAAAVQVALGQSAPQRLLTHAEADYIRGPLFPDSYKSQIGANLVRLDAFLSGLAQYSQTGPPAPPPAYCTVLTAEPAARSARAELMAALVIQWLTAAVTASTTSTPAIVIAAADEITRPHLECLSDACERRGVQLTFLFRHLRDDAVGIIGGAAAAFMRLGNHHEAEQAASYIGRHHAFALSQFTATHGAEQAHSRGSSRTWGSGESRGRSTTSGWAEDHLLLRTASGSRTRSREYSKNYSFASERSQSDGTNWSDAVTMQRVYEYAVEPTILQNLPDHALLLTTRANATTNLQSVECHPSIVTLPNVSTAPLAPLPAHPGPGAAPLNGPEIATRIRRTGAGG